MYCISINYKQLKTESREAFSMQEKEQEAFFSRIQKEVSIDGVILLMTCNRCEIYAAGSKDTMSVIDRIWLAQKPGKEELFYEHIMRYEKENAIRHLYCVICGLDSAVLGEVEIIHQIKAAYLFSKAHDMLDSTLHIIFQGALHLAKEIASQYQLTKLPVSVGTLTTGAVLSFCQEKKEPHILLVGARGEMGNIIMKDIVDACQTVQIVATTRKHHRQGLAFADTKQIRWVHYEERYDYVDWADVVISVTNSPHYTFVASKVQKYLKESKMRLFLDLAVPRDIEEEIGTLSDCVIENMDYIESLAKHNNQKKLSEAKKVELYIQEKTDEMEKTLLMRDFYAKKKEQTVWLQDKSASWLLYRLKDHVDHNCFAQILDVIGTAQEQSTERKEL